MLWRCFHWSGNHAVSWPRGVDGRLTSGCVRYSCGSMALRRQVLVRLAKIAAVRPPAGCPRIKSSSGLKRCASSPVRKHCCRSVPRDGWRRHSTRSTGPGHTEWPRSSDGRAAVAPSIPANARGTPVDSGNDFARRMRTRSSTVSGCVWRSIELRRNYGGCPRISPSPDFPVPGFPRISVEGGWGRTEVASPVVGDFSVVCRLGEIARLGIPGFLPIDPC